MTRRQFIGSIGVATIGAALLKKRSVESVELILKGKAVARLFVSVDLVDYEPKNRITFQVNKDVEFDGFRLVDRNGVVWVNYPINKVTLHPGDALTIGLPEIKIG